MGYIQFHKPWGPWDFFKPNWCRISAITSISLSSLDSVNSTKASRFDFDSSTSKSLPADTSNSLPAERIRDKCLVVFVLTSCEKIISKYKKRPMCFFNGGGNKLWFSMKRGYYYFVFLCWGCFFKCCNEKPLCLNENIRWGNGNPWLKTRSRRP